MNITVIGTGYVGLVSGAVFADWGHNVMCLDVDEKKIQMIKDGVMPIYEEGLEELVEKVTREKRFTPTTNYKKAVDHGEVLFICVGTPSNQSGAADLSFVDKVAESIGKNMESSSYKVIVTKSTVPVGTHKRVEENLLKGAGEKKLDYDIASCPEFLREGTSIEDANNSDRTVIGSSSKKALEMLESIYSTIDAPVIKTDIASAELIKYAANAFLATKISFINEISQICERVGADVKEVAAGIGSDKRIGSSMLYAGIGYGGSCFPKDVEALYRTSSENFYDFRLLRGVMDTNERARASFEEKVFKKYGHNLTGLNFGVLGAAFKYKTDDVRKSAAIEIIRTLRGAGAKVKVTDPAALENAKKELGNDYVMYHQYPAEVFEGSDAVLLLTEWVEFKNIDYAALKSKMKKAVLFDGRNLLDPKQIRDLGYEYYSVGRP